MRLGSRFWLWRNDICYRCGKNIDRQHPYSSFNEYMDTCGCALKDFKERKAKCLSKFIPAPLPKKEPLRVEENSVIIPVDSKYVTKIECYREPEWNEYRVELHMGKKDDVLVLSFRDSIYINEVVMHERRRNGDLDCDTIYTKDCK